MFCWKQMRALKGNGDRSTTKRNTLFLLSDDDQLPVIDIHPFSKLIDMWKTEGETVSTLRWWSMAANRCESFKQIDGQVKNRRRKCFYLRWWNVASDRCASFKQIDGEVENRRRNCLYFAMMICCCWWISVLQRHLGTGGEPKEKLFVLSDDDVLLLMDLRPSKTFTDRWRTEGETVSTLQWWTVATDRCASFKEFDGQVKNRSSDWFYFGLMICFGNQMPLRIHRSALMKWVVYMGDTD